MSRMDEPSELLEAEAPQTFSTAEDVEDFAVRDDYALNPRFVEVVMEAAEEGDSARLRQLIAPLRPGDVADLIGFMPPEHRDAVVGALSPEAFADVLPELDDQIREEVLSELSPARLAEAVSTLDSDDAAAIVEDLEADQREAVLAAMPDIERAAVESSLSYE